MKRRERDEGRKNILDCSEFLLDYLISLVPFMEVITDTYNLFWSNFPSFAWLMVYHTLISGSLGLFSTEEYDFSSQWLVGQLYILLPYT